MAIKHPEWHPLGHPGYETAMSAANDMLLTRLAADPEFRASILADPRDLHRLLYAPFAPASHPEYAGTYRGEPGTSLERRVMGGPSVIDPGEVFGFLKASAVPGAIAHLLNDVRAEMASADAPWLKLRTLAYLFATFGAYHPFLDGNGHVQRTMFAAAALEMGLPLSNRFAIHPRSYDLLLGLVLEQYTRDEIRRGEWLTAVAEYVAQWLGGPFDAPGSGLAPL